MDAPCQESDLQQDHSHHLNTMSSNDTLKTPQNCENVNSDGQIQMNTEVELCGAEVAEQVTTACSVGCLVRNVTGTRIEAGGELNFHSDCLDDEQSNLPEQIASFVLDQEETVKSCDPGGQPKMNTGRFLLSESVDVVGNVGCSGYSGGTLYTHADLDKGGIVPQEECLENQPLTSVVQQNGEALDTTPSKTDHANEMVADSCMLQMKGNRKRKPSRGRVRKRRGKKISRSKPKALQKDCEPNKSMESKEGGDLLMEKINTEQYLQFHSEQGVEDKVETHQKRHENENQAHCEEELQTFKSTVSCELGNTRDMKCYEERYTEAYDKTTCETEVCKGEITEGKAHNTTTSEGLMLVQNRMSLVESDCKDLLITAKDPNPGSGCLVSGQKEAIAYSHYCDAGTQTQEESGAAKFPEGQYDDGSATSSLGEGAFQHDIVVNSQCNDMTAEDDDGKCVKSTMEQREEVIEETLKNSKISLRRRKTACVSQDVPVRELRECRKTKVLTCKECKKSVDVYKENTRSSRKRSKAVTESKCMELHSDGMVQDSNDSGEVVALSEVVDDSGKTVQTKYLKPCTDIKHGKVVGTESVNEVKKYCTRSSKRAHKGYGSGNQLAVKCKKKVRHIRNKGKLDSEERSELEITSESLENNATVMQENDFSVSECEPQHEAKSQQAPHVLSEMVHSSLDECGKVSDVSIVSSSDVFSVKKCFGSEEGNLNNQTDNKILFQSSAIQTEGRTVSHGESGGENERRENLCDMEHCVAPQEQNVNVKQSVTENEYICEQTEENRKNDDKCDDGETRKKLQQSLEAPTGDIRKAECSKLHKEMSAIENSNVESDTLCRYDVEGKNPSVMYSVTAEISGIALEDTSTPQDSENEIGRHKYIETASDEKDCVMEEKEVECLETHDNVSNSLTQGASCFDNSLAKSCNNCKIEKESNMSYVCTTAPEKDCKGQKSLECKEEQCYEVVEKYPPKTDEMVLEKTALQQDSGNQGEGVVPHKTVKGSNWGRFKSSRLKREKKPKSKDTAKCVEIKETVFLKTEDNLRLHSHQTMEGTEKYDQEEQTDYKSKPQFSKLVLCHELEKREKCGKRNTVEGSPSGKVIGNPGCDVLCKVPSLKNTKMRNTAMLTDENLFPEGTNTSDVHRKNSGTCKDVEHNTDPKYFENGIGVCTDSKPLVLKKAKMIVKQPEDYELKDLICRSACRQFSKTDLQGCDTATSSNSEGMRMSVCENEQVNSENVEYKRAELLKHRGKHADVIKKVSHKDCQIVWESSSLKTQERPGFKMFEDGLRERNFISDQENDQKDTKSMAVTWQKDLLVEKAISKKLVGEGFDSQGTSCKDLFYLKHEADHQPAKYEKTVICEEEKLNDFKFCNTVKANEHNGTASEISKEAGTVISSDEICLQAEQMKNKTVKNKGTYRGSEIDNLPECIKSSGSVYDKNDCLILDQNREVDCTEDVCRDSQKSSKPALVHHIKTEVLLDYEAEDPSASGRNFKALKCVDVKTDLPAAGRGNEECQIVWESRAQRWQTSVGICDGGQTKKEHLGPDKETRQRKRKGGISKWKKRIVSRKLRRRMHEQVKEMKKNLKYDVVERQKRYAESSKIGSWQDSKTGSKKVWSCVKENKQNLQSHDEAENQNKVPNSKTAKNNEKFPEMSENKVVGVNSEMIDVGNGQQLSRGTESDCGSLQDPLVLEQTCHLIPDHTEKMEYAKKFDLRLESSLLSGSSQCETDCLKKSSVCYEVTELPEEGLSALYEVTDPPEEGSTVLYEVTEPPEENSSVLYEVAEPTELYKCMFHVLNECETDCLKKSSVIYEVMEPLEESGTCIHPQEDPVLAVGKYNFEKFVECREQDDAGSQTVPKKDGMWCNEYHELKHHAMGHETVVGHQYMKFYECDTENNNLAKDAGLHKKEEKTEGSSADHTIKSCTAMLEDTAGSSCWLKKKHSEDSYKGARVSHNEQEATEEITCISGSGKKESNIFDQVGSEQQCGSDINELQADEVEALSWEEKMLLEVWPEEDTEGKNENTGVAFRPEVQNLKQTLSKDDTKVNDVAVVRRSTSNSNSSVVELTKGPHKIQLNRRSLGKEETDQREGLNARFRVLLKGAESTVREINSPDIPRYLFQYGRHSNSPYHYSRFSDRSIRFSGARLNVQSEPLASENQWKNALAESDDTWTAEKEHLVNHGDKRQTDEAMKAAELQKTLKELEHQIEKIEAKKSLSCKLKDKEESSDTHSNVKLQKFEDKSTTFGNNQSLQISSLENCKVRCQTNSKSDVDCTRRFHNSSESSQKYGEQKSWKTKIELSTCEKFCGEKVSVSRVGESMRHIEFTRGQGHKCSSHELGNTEVRQHISGNYVLQKRQVSDEVTNKKPNKSKQTENELRMLQYLQVSEGSDLEDPDSRQKADHMETKCTSSVISTLCKNSKQEASNMENKVTRYQCGNLTCIVPDENLGSGGRADAACQSAEVNNVRRGTRKESTDLFCTCDKLRKEDGEVSSESESSYKPIRAQDDLDSKKEKISSRYSDLKQIEYINKMNSCGDFSPRTSRSRRGKHRNNRNIQRHLSNYVNDFNKYEFSMGKYKAYSKPYPTELKKRDGFGSFLLERGKFDKPQSKSFDDWAGNDLECGEYGQAGYNKYSCTQQRFKNLPCHCHCDDTVSVAKRGPKEEQARRDKMKHSAENLVKRQLEVISSHVEGKQHKNFRQKISDPSGGKREKKHSKLECLEKVGKTKCSSFAKHDSNFLQQEDIAAIIEELQEKTVRSLHRQRCLSPLSVKGRNSRQDRTEKSPDLDLPARIIGHLQTSPDLKKMKLFKSMKRSHSQTHSNYDDFCDRKIVSPKWMEKKCQRHLYFQKEKSLEKKQDRNSLSEKRSSHYQGKSPSKFSSREDVAAVENDDASSVGSDQELQSRTPSRRVSGGTEKNKKIILMEEEHVCKRLKKSKEREADRSPSRGLFSSTRTRDRQICPEKMAKSSHTHEAEQTSKSSDGNTKQDKRRGSRDVELKAAKKHCKKTNLSPERLLLKVLLHNDVEAVADSSYVRDSVQPSSAGSTNTANKESLQKSKNKATANSCSEKCTAQHSVCPSSKHEKSVAQGESSSLQEDETEFEKNKNLEDIKDGKVDESCELLKHYWDMFSA